jgi:hypothetical protein
MVSTVIAIFDQLQLVEQHLLALGVAFGPMRAFLRSLAIQTEAKGGRRCSADQAESVLVWRQGQKSLSRYALSQA